MLIGMLYTVYAQEEKKSYNNDTKMKGMKSVSVFACFRTTLDFK